MSMSKKKRVAKYPAEFRAQMLELVQRGRTPAELAREFDVDSTTIRTWMRQSAVDGDQVEGVKTDERAELIALRKQTKELLEEREILKKYAAWAGQETSRLPKRSGS
jgi:transposase